MSDVELRALIKAAQGSRDALFDVGPRYRARWIAEAMKSLLNDSEALALPLAQSAGLSSEMIQWGLQTSLETFHEQALAELAHVAPPHENAKLARAGSLAAVVLSGNVFTACLKAVALPLLFGLPVVAKASSRDDVLPKALENALKQADPRLSHAVAVSTFSAQEELLTDLLLREADVLSVYGSDETVERLRARTPASTSFIAHGHGLGVAFLSRAALDDEDAARELANELAIDIAAYDQRGCLSPQIVWLERGANVASDHFAELLFQALERVELKLPRGPLPLDVASAQMQWRGVSALKGVLLENEKFAVALAHDEALGENAEAGQAFRVRIGPGYRNVLLIETESAASFCHAIAPLGVHLKNLGVANADDARLIASTLGPRCAPRICPVGTMQTPGVASFSDGLPPWEGFVRFIDTDAFF